MTRFGARGDGARDDTAAIQRAIDHAPEEGVVIVFPRSTYRISGTIYPRANQMLTGVYPLSVVDPVAGFDHYGWGIGMPTPGTVCESGW